MTSFRDHLERVECMLVNGNELKHPVPLETCHQKLVSQTGASLQDNSDEDQYYIYTSGSEQY